MKNLLKYFKTKEDVEKFKVRLSERLKSNNPISNNPMLDGMIIGFILTNGYVEDLFLQKQMGAILESSAQKLDQILIWCINNEDKIIKEVIPVSMK